MGEIAPDRWKKFRLQEEADFGDDGAKKFFSGVGVEFFKVRLFVKRRCQMLFAAPKNNLVIDASNESQISTEKLLFRDTFNLRS